MKVLVVSNYRGLHTCRPEAEIFIGLKKMGHQVTVITYPNADYIPNFEKAGIRVLPHHPTKKYDRKFIAFLRKELQDGGYDILQLYNNKAISNGVRSARGIDVKVVVYRGASWNMAWWNPINYLKFFHPRVDYVVCNSEEIRQRFLSVPFYKKEKAVTIYKGHDTRWYEGIRAHDIRTELSIDKEDLLFVNVANNRKFKAIPDLMKAMGQIPKEAKVSLVVIGDKMDTIEIRRLAKESGNEEKIYFLGFRKDSINIVASSDIFVLPSIGGESLTKSVIEAMSLGTVPMISNIAGNAPLVDDGINGFVFRKADPKDLAKKMMFAYQNRHILPELSKGAIMKIDQDISNAETIRQYAEFYHRIIK